MLSDYLILTRKQETALHPVTSVRREFPEGLLQEDRAVRFVRLNVCIT